MIMAAKRNWTVAEDALLGTLPDTEVARRLGITKLSASNRRKKLRIPAAKTALRPSPNPDVLDGRRIRDLTADEYLQAAQLMRRMKRF
jgi:hypothetical protein